MQNFELILNILEHPKPSISSLKQPGILLFGNNSNICFMHMFYLTTVSREDLPCGRETFQELLSLHMYPISVGIFFSFTRLQSTKNDCSTRSLADGIFRFCLFMPSGFFQ